MYWFGNTQLQAILAVEGLFWDADIAGGQLGPDSCERPRQPQREPARRIVDGLRDQARAD